MRPRLTAVFLALAGAALCAPAHADIDIRIEGATRELEQNVRAFLSLTRYAQRDDLEEDTVTRLAARIPGETRRALQPLGYYDPEVTYNVQQEKKNWRITVFIAAGRAVRVSEVNIDIAGPGRDAPALQRVLERRILRPGQRLNHGSYESLKAELLRTAINNGYLDARWNRSELLIDREERRAYAHLDLETGPLYRFGAISVKQNVITDERMRRLLRMREGDPFSLNALLQSQYILDDTQYFSGATVESGTRNRDELSVPVNVAGERNKRNRYAVSTGYGTDTQARGKLTWNNRYLNKYGHRSTVELVGSGVGYEATVRYTLPVFDIALEKLEFAYTKEKEELADATSYRDELSGSFTQVLGTWQRVLFVRLSDETSEYPDRSEDTFLIIPGISYSTVPTYVLGQSQRRYSVYGELSGSPSSLGSGASFLRVLLQGERVFNLAEPWRLRLRAQVGSIWSDDFSAVPASMRFFAGGDNSVRGFGLNELSPLDETGQRVGGRNLLVGTLEVERDLPRNFGAAVFADAGNAIDRFSDPLEYSAGVGMRYRISVASVGLDVAHPLSEPGKGFRLHLHISTLF